MNVEKTAVSADDMALINQYSRAELSADDVYSFKMVCCDSKIDRDGEAFSVNALHEMAKLFVGKTVITDHKPSQIPILSRLSKRALSKKYLLVVPSGNVYVLFAEKPLMPVITGNSKTMTAKLVTVFLMK